MTVKELREFLETCPQDIQVVIVAPSDKITTPVRYSIITDIAQTKPYSCHDEPKYPDVVEIAIG